MTDLDDIPASSEEKDCSEETGRQDREAGGLVFHKLLCRISVYNKG